MNNIHQHGDEPKRRYRRSVGAFVLAGSVAAGLAACGDKDNAVPAAEDPPAQEEKFWEPYINLPAPKEEKFWEPYIDLPVPKEENSFLPYLEYQAGMNELSQQAGR